MTLRQCKLAIKLFASSGLLNAAIRNPFIVGNTKGIKFSCSLRTEVIANIGSSTIVFWN